MRKCLIFLLCVCLLVVVASADELVDSSDDLNEYYDDPNVVIGEVVTVNAGSYGDWIYDTESVADDPLEASAVSSETSSDSSLAPDSGSSGFDDGISVLSVGPISSGGSDSIKDCLLGVIGSYDPVVGTYTDSNGYIRYEFQPDYPWIAAFLLLSLTVLCVFKLWGVVLARI